MELMVTPAAQEMMRWRSSMSGPISSRTKGMMWGFTARKSTSLLETVSLLLVVRFTPILCRGRTQNRRGKKIKTKHRDKGKKSYYIHITSLTHTRSHCFHYFPFSDTTQPCRNDVSSHPQSRHSGQVCVWWAGCNSVCSNHTWWGRKEEVESEVWRCTLQ